MSNPTFDLAPLPAPMAGSRLLRGSEWIGTVWHSNFWGWQWARIRTDDVPLIGGKCANFDEGVANVERLCRS